MTTIVGFHSNQQGCNCSSNNNNNNAIRTTSRTTKTIKWNKKQQQLKTIKLLCQSASSYEKCWNQLLTSTLHFAICVESIFSHWKSMANLQLPRRFHLTRQFTQSCSNRERPRRVSVRILVTNMDIRNLQLQVLNNIWYQLLSKAVLLWIFLKIYSQKNHMLL